MHENLTITDGTYGVLSENDVRNQITELGEIIVANKNSELKELKSLAQKLLEKIDKI